jgi:hypothetical protein
MLRWTACFNKKLIFRLYHLAITLHFLEKSTKSQPLTQKINCWPKKSTFDPKKSIFCIKALRLIFVAWLFSLWHYWSLLVYSIFKKNLFSFNFPSFFFTKTSKKGKSHKTK